MREKGSRGAGIVENLLKDPAKLVVAILVGNNIVLVIASSLTASAFEVSGMVISPLLAFLLCIFGEITPKIIFYRYSIPIIPALGRPINLIYKLLLPLANLSMYLSSFFIRQRGKPPFISRRELRFVMEEGRREGVVGGDELQMLDAVLRFPTAKVKEIMTPRVDMVCIKAEATLEEILKLYKEHRYSRIPVYKKNIDEVIGILYVKDLLREWENPNIYVVAEDFAHVPYFVPETMPLTRLFHEFRFRGVHMMMVVDEYGGIAGLVTMEDLLEEVVGEIRDEYDLREETPYKIIGKGVYIVKGKADITLLNKDLGLELKGDGFETISGLILNRLGRIPLPGETIKLGDIKLTILVADERSIKLVRLEEKTE
jgi:CBS domain containing-hemolysin-like protein